MIFLGVFIVSNATNSVLKRPMYEKSAPLSDETVLKMFELFDEAVKHRFPLLKKKVFLLVSS